MADLTDTVQKNPVGIRAFADDHQLSVQCCPVGVMFSSDLSLNKHVSTVPESSTIIGF